MYPIMISFWQSRHTYFAALCTTTLLLLMSIKGWAESQENLLDTLDTQLHTLSHQVYQAQSLKMPAGCKKFASVKKLVNATKKIAKQDPLQAVACISANTSTLENEIDSDLVADIAWFLYQHKASDIAARLRQIAIDNFSDYTKSRIQFQQAKYFFTQGRWEDVITTLQQTDIELTLKQNEADYAYFITGVALQNIQQHRDALKVYSSIGAKSAYFTPAQINSAVANIRQGWWTDAHLALKQAIKIEKKNKNFELVDRMYLMLGFSQIQNEFYRDARKSFREIGLDSAYVNRALLGIGLSAMHQKDFKSSLKAFTLLADKTPVDSYVQQAYLLVPYAHEKLGQKRLAEAKYTQAAAYFQQQITKMKRALNNKTPSFSQNALDAAYLTEKESDDQTQVINNLGIFAINSETRIQRSLDHIALLNAHANSAKKNQLAALKQQYTKQLHISQANLLRNAQSVYQSYFNQCQYALARLYDENL